MRRKCFSVLLAVLCFLSACGADGKNTPALSPVPTVQAAEESPAPRPVRTAETTEDGLTIITFACPDYERGRFHDLAQDFEETNPNVDVQFIPYDEAAGIQHQGSTMSQSGNAVENLAAAADTFLHPARIFPTDWSLLLDLGLFVDDPSFPADDFFPGTLDHFRWEGGVYGLPAYLNPILIFFDHGMFDEAGLPYPQTGWTWDDLLQVAVQLTEREGGEVGRFGFVDAYFSSTIPAMIQQYGVALWDERADPPRPLFDTPEVAEVLRRYADLALRYDAMPLPEFGSNVMASSLINGGKVAMWTAMAFDRDYHANRTNLGLAPFPEAVDAANPRGIYGLFISAGTAHPEVAWRWLSFLSANYQPFLPGQVPGRRSVAEQMAWWIDLEDEERAVFEYALAHPVAGDPFDFLLTRTVYDVFEEGAGLEEALAATQQRALDWQSALAEETPRTPRPVASPPTEPTPREGQSVITFSPAMSTDAPLYRELAVRFAQSHAEIQVEVVAESVFDPEELARTCDCFGWTGSLVDYAAYEPEVLQHVRPLGPLMDLDASFDLADYYPQFLEPLRQEGELWGLPYQVNALMVYLNLDRFTAAGVASPETGWIIEDFLELAAALGDDGIYGFTTAECAYGDLVFVLLRLGARLFDYTHEPPTPTFDDATVVAALERYAGLNRGQALSMATAPQQCGWPTHSVGGGPLAGVETGQVAMWVDYVWNHWATSRGEPLPFEVGAAPLPVGATKSSEFMPWAYYISAHTSEPQACWEWLVFLSEQPEVVDLLPTRRSVAGSSAWQARVEQALLPAYLATLEYESADIFYLRWEIPWLAYAYPWLNEAFEAAVAGKDAADALTTAQARAEALVSCLEAVDGFSDHERLLACARQVDPDFPPGFEEQ